MKRGDIVTIATSGPYGKPRPALVVQDNAFDAIPSVTVLPLTSEIYDEHLIRITIAPEKITGLKVASQAMVDKVTTVPKAKIGDVIGWVETETMRLINRALKRFLGL